MTTTTKAPRFRRTLTGGLTTPTHGRNLTWPGRGWTHLHLVSPRTGDAILVEPDRYRVWSGEERDARDAMRRFLEDGAPQHTD